MKLKKLFIFLSGSTLTLIVLWFIIPLFPNFHATFILTASTMETLTAIGTLGAVIVALFIAIFADRLKEWGGYKSDIQIIDHLENIQENYQKVKQGQTRLVFINKGKATAEDVEVYINKIWNDKAPRPNFLPVPISWTHDGRSKRTFHPDQFGYLDLYRINDIVKKTPPVFVLTAGGGIPTYEDVKEGITILELVIFQKSGGNKKYKITLEWKPSFDWVQVKHIHRE